MKENNPRIKLYIACSLDGFIARENGSIDWLTEYENSPETDYGYSEFYASIGTVLMGRKTYEQVLGFGDWPYGEKKTYVFTRQNEPLPREKNVEFVSGNVGEFVRRLKENTDRGYLARGRFAAYQGVSRRKPCAGFYCFRCSNYSWEWDSAV